MQGTKEVGDSGTDFLPHLSRASVSIFSISASTLGPGKSFTLGLTHIADGHTFIFIRCSRVFKMMSLWSYLVSVEMSLMIRCLWMHEAVHFISWRFWQSMMILCAVNICLECPPTDLVLRTKVRMQLPWQPYKCLHCAGLTPAHNLDLFT